MISFRKRNWSSFRDNFEVVTAGTRVTAGACIVSLTLDGTDEIHTRLGRIFLFRSSTLVTRSQ